MKCPNCETEDLEETEFDDQVYCPGCQMGFEITNKTVFNKVLDELEKWRKKALDEAIKDKIDDEQEGWNVDFDRGYIGALEDMEEPIQKLRKKE